MNCQYCEKQIISAEDWGDYYNTIEIACQCYYYFVDYCTLCQSNNVHRKLSNGKVCLTCHKHTIETLAKVLKH